MSTLIFLVFCSFSKSVFFQVIKMLVAIIVLFAICWGPTFIDDVLVAYGVVSKLNYGHLKPMRQVILHLTIFTFLAY